MLLHKTALTLKPILELAKQETGKGYVYADKEKVFATDGCCLVLIKNPDQNREELLSPFAEEEYKECEKVTINETALNKIEKNLPKNPTTGILNNFIVGEQNDNIVFFVLDVEDTIKIKQSKDKQQYHPNVDKLFEELKDTKYVSLRLQLRLLERCITVLKKIQNMVKLPKEIAVDFKLPEDKGKPAVIELKWENVDQDQGIDKIEAIAVIMPMSA